MLYAVFKWRLSILSFLPSSRQTMKSGWTDFFTGTAGCGGSAAGIVPILASEVYTWLIKTGKSPTATVLLDTCAATISVVSASKSLFWSEFVIVGPYPMPHLEI